MLNKIGSVLLLVVVLIGCNQPKTSNIDLSGEWNYKLDESNTGVQEKWYTQKLENTIHLPSALRDHNIGNTPTLKTKWTGSIYDSTWFFNPAMEKYRKKDSLKFPFWLTPVKHYVGAAWYQKEIEIPENWNGKIINLELERPHWQTQVWIDSISLGTQNSLSVPHIFKTDNFKAGKHLLTVRVDNAIRDLDPGINSHSISDHTQGNWNGMVGKMLLSAENEYTIKNVRLTPSLDNKNVEAKLIFNTEISVNTTLTINVKGLNQEHSIDPLTIEVPENSNEFKVEFPMGDDFKLWSEFTPNLYEMDLKLKVDDQVLSQVNETFYNRKIQMPTLLKPNAHCFINGLNCV